MSTSPLVNTIRAFGERVRSVMLLIRRNLRLIAGVSIMAAAAAYAGSYLVAEEYRSTLVFFVDRGGRGLSLPSGLASLGRSLNLPDADDSQPMDFYAWLAISDDVLREVLEDSVPAAARRPEKSPDVWRQVLNMEAPSDSVRRARGIGLLRQRISTQVNAATGTIEVSGGAPTRSVARWLTERVFLAVNDANTDRRRTRAGNELRFLRNRVTEAAGRLRQAESELAAFHNANRQTSLPPTLRYVEERLQRQVDLSRDVYVTLAKSAEETELRAVRDIPALTLISSPSMPLRRSKPRRTLLAAVAGLLGAMMAFSYAWWRELESAR